MPANRSRTLEWRRCLKQVCERGGALEIAVAHEADQSCSNHHLVWRVRLMGVSDSEILVEQPIALGQAIPINPGIELAVILSIGQNRWMFSTKNLGMCSVQSPERRLCPALRLAMPESVQRCQRRNHYRVETTVITLPQIEMWPLLDPKSVVVAERAYEIRFEADNRANGQSESPMPVFDYDSVMPEVGPKFAGALLNLGGGGVGLRIGPDDAQIVARHKLFWMRIALSAGTDDTDLRPTGKVVHTHIESNHDTYVGVAFDFSFNPAHQRFVVDQICRYIAWQQRMQTQSFQMPAAQRRTA